MPDRKIMAYKVSRQLKLALEGLHNRILQKEYKVVESQDILFCLLEVCDTGLGYALGYYSLTKGRLLREYSSGKRIGSERRSTVETEELNGFSKRKLLHDLMTSSSVEIIQEPSSLYYFTECDEFPMSEYLKSIFDFAEEMRLQNSPDGVIDSFWILLGISQEQETNANQLIYKQYLLAGRNSYSEDGLLDVFPISVEMELKPHKNAWQNRELDYDDYLYTASKLYTKYISNKDILDVEFVAKKVIEKESKKLYRFTRDRIKWHKEQGHKIIFISGSPDFLVEKMAEKLDADLWFASQYLNDGNKYSGEVIPMWDSDSKKRVLERLPFDLENSYSYGDTTGDFTMLQMTGHPTAINPNQKLLDKLNKERVACNIVVERKDVIYSINDIS